MKTLAKWRFTSAQHILSGITFAALIYQILNIWTSLQSSLAFYYAHLGLILSICGLALITDVLGEQGGQTWRRRTYLCILVATLIAAVSSTLYLNLQSDGLQLRQPFVNSTDKLAGGALIASVLVLSQKIWGKILTGVMVAAIVYYAFGRYLPGPFHYPSPDSGILMTDLAGLGAARGLLWGIPLSANVIFLIIVYGGALKGLRILHMFNEIGKGLTNLTSGGVCYSSILAATAIGMVTGQPVANVVLAGPITIGAMKEHGFSSETSAALVTLASLGSQLIPPIMGLGGFLMAVNIGVPYVDIAAAAVVPAFLYMSSIVIASYLVIQSSTSVKRVKVQADWRAVLWILPSFLISFSTLIYLLYERYSPEYAALWSLMLVIGTSFLRPGEYRPRFEEMFSGVRFGVVSAAHLALVLTGIGLVVQVLVTTGAGFGVGGFLMQAAGGSLLLVLLFAMFIAIFAGLGLPTPAAYALIAIITVPFIQNVGVPAISAHFFGFYFAVFSAITPPVAVACMAAARIADANFYRTVLEAGKVALVTFLIPFSFVVFPSILGFPQVTINMIAVVLTLLTSTATWGSLLYGWFRRPLNRKERAFMALGPIGFIAMLLTGVTWYALVPFVVLCVAYIVFRPRAEIGEARVDRLRPLGLRLRIANRMRGN